MTPFAPARDFLHATLEGRFAAPRQWQTATLSLQWQAEGVLALAPLDAADALDHVLLSTGIHGNETAPIEVVNSIVNDLLAGAMPLRCRLLVMLGNPVAMRSGARFTDYDMNRLFNGAHISQPQAQEARRAAELEQLAADFFRAAPAGVQRLHYDLHTAIRGSVFEKFAIYPYTDGRPHKREQLLWLESADVSTLLLHSKPAATFSYYTSHHFHADALTLELGKARPFGDNDLSRFAGIDRALRRLVSGSTPPLPAYDASRFAVFHAKYDLVKHSEQFKLHLADSVENFTALPHGMTIAEDGDIRYVADGGEERILFPNPKVGVGLRAGIVISPCQLD